jgi:hypothetical protein
VRYRITFTRRFESDGREGSIGPSFALDSSLADGVVAEKVFAGRLEPQAQHSQAVLNADDVFPGSAAPEIWEYEIVDERAAEFEEGILRSGGVLEYEVLDEAETDPEDVTGDIPASDPSAGGLSVGPWSVGFDTEEDLRPENSRETGDLNVKGNGSTLGPRKG